MHSFSGSLEEAKRFMDLGMMISFSGVVTFRRATDVKPGSWPSMIRYWLDRCPLSGTSSQGPENKAAYTRYVDVLQHYIVTTEEVAQATYDNAKGICT